MIFNGSRVFYSDHIGFLGFPIHLVRGFTGSYLPSSHQLVLELRLQGPIISFILVFLRFYSKKNICIVLRLVCSCSCSADFCSFSVLPYFLFFICLHSHIKKKKRRRRRIIYSVVFSILLGLCSCLCVLSSSSCDHYWVDIVPFFSALLLASFLFLFDSILKKKKK